MKSLFEFSMLKLHFSYCITVCSATYRDVASWINQRFPRRTWAFVWVIASGRWWKSQLNSKQTCSRRRGSIWRRSGRTTSTSTGSLTGTNCLKKPGKKYSNYILDISIYFYFGLVCLKFYILYLKLVTKQKDTKHLLETRGLKC